MAVLVPERTTRRQAARTFVEPLTFAFAFSLALLGAVLGWNARAQALTPRVHAPPFAEAYVDALCRQDVAYLRGKTGEGGRVPWEPRLSRWTQPCTGHRYLGSLQDLIGRDQHVFTLLRPDGTEVVYLVTIGRDGVVAGVD